MKEPIFRPALRTFFSMILGTIGVVIGFVIIVTIILALISNEEGFSSHVQLRPDAEGNRKELSAKTPVLLEMRFDGTIGLDGFTADRIEEVLLNSREDEFEDNRVKGILLVINSPGGSANDSDLIYHYLKQYKARYNVPIYAFVEGLCASGGYYIACAADKIFATDTSLIGSIGVLSWPPFFNVKKTMEIIGVDAMTLTAGRGKDEMNPFRPWKEGEQKHYQEMIDFLYGRFVDIVATARPHLSKEKVIENGAVVFPAPQAAELGYIDRQGMLQSDALKELALASGIKEGDKYQVVTLQKKSFWKKMLEEKSPLITGKLHHQIHIPSEFKAEGGYPFAYIYTTP